MQVYLHETCSDVRERSGIKKLIWEYCISYSTSIGVVFGPTKPVGVGLCVWVCVCVCVCVFIVITF